MNTVKRYLAPALACLGLMTSCDDTVSQLGESIQTPEDKVESHVRYLQFEASTVPAGQIHTGGSTLSLLGEIADPVYGDFRAEYLAQMRTAPEWSPSYTPIDGIDSAVLTLDIHNYVGSTTAPLNLAVYSAPLGYKVEAQSVSDLSEVREQSTLLKQKVYTVEKDFPWVHISSTDSVRRMSINLGKDFGQRIYELSKSHPEYFQTQQAFNEHVLGGLLLTTTTGRGSVVQVLGTTLQLHYRFMQADTVAQARVGFISSRTTGHTNALSSSYIDDLLQPSTQHSYIKQPAGVVTQIKLPKEQMNRLMASVGKVTIGADWTLADTQLKLEVDNPSDLLLNPPQYMLLLPVDSVQSFFETEQTELSRATSSYLSNAYTVERRYYNFSNIARLITGHLQKHATYSAGLWTVDKDLVLYMLPVLRTTTGNSSNLTTTALTEYLFPSFVRLDTRAEKLRLGVVSSKFSQ